MLFDSILNQMIDDVNIFVFTNFFIDVFFVKIIMNVFDRLNEEQIIKTNAVSSIVEQQNASNSFVFSIYDTSKTLIEFLSCDVTKAVAISFRNNQKNDSSSHEEQRENDFSSHEESFDNDSSSNENQFVKNDSSSNEEQFVDNDSSSHEEQFENDSSSHEEKFDAKIFNDIALSNVFFTQIRIARKTSITSITQKKFITKTKTKTRSITKTKKLLKENKNKKFVVERKFFLNYVFDYRFVNYITY
jgi:hypothetical protein